MFEKVLVATDMLEACDAAVLTALGIAQQNKGKLYVLHVLESASTIYRKFVKHFITGAELVCTEEYQKTVKEKIDKKIAIAREADVNYEITVSTGFPWEEIIKLARKRRVDLIILGPHAGMAAEKGVVRTAGTIGSTIEGVIKRERCPVMIVNRVISKGSLEFKRIVVSIDFSKSCRYALQFAIRYAQKYNSKLFIFHMLPIPPFSQYSQADYEADIGTVEKKLRALCEEIPNGVDREYKVWGGVLPHLEIEKYAENEDADLIIMGSHTKENDGKWYVGSAVERLSLRSLCPVIVVTHLIS
jgi:nucleotide-binding universal stress UspA family protein